MKRRNHRIDAIAEYPNLLLAFSKAARAKRFRGNVRAFEETLPFHLRQMATRLQSGDFPVGDYCRFVIRDPKKRTIHAAAFPERVLHHAIMNVAGPDFERGAIDDSYACRIGKGNLAALATASRFANRNCFFLKLDIRRFFDSVDHEILKKRFLHLFKDRAFLDLLGRIVDSFHTQAGKGLPIGTLTSQYFANFYLDRFDRFVKEELRCRAYVRFMDDFVLWHDDPGQLEDWLAAIAEWLAQERKLTLKGQNNGPELSPAGLPFLGYRLKPGGRVLLGRKARKRFVRRLGEYDGALQNGRMSEAEWQRRVDALLAFIDVAESAEWRQRILGNREPTGF